MSEHTQGPVQCETVRTDCGVCHKVGPFPGRRPGDKPRHACLYADYPSAGNPADVELAANARRLAAAWNACQGIPTEVLEATAHDRLGAAIARATGGKT